MKKTKLYNLEYYIGKNLVETILYQKPKALVVSTKNKLSKTSHKLGSLILKPC